MRSNLSTRKEGGGGFPARNTDRRWLNYIERKVELSERLAEGALGGDYGDAMILLCVRLSGMAADLWPGARIDGLRFPEAIVLYADPELQPGRISVPLLFEWLRQEGREAELLAIAERWPEACRMPVARVLQGAEVDVLEGDVLAVAPTLSLPEVRRWSYAAVLYADFRSALVHEAHLGNSADERAHGSANELVSYTNVLEGTTLRASRRLHFDLRWPARAVLSIAEQVDRLGHTRQPVPKAWWVHGG